MLNMMNGVMRHFEMAKQTLGLIDAMMFQDGVDLEPTNRQPIFLSLEQGTEAAQQPNEEEPPSSMQLLYTQL